MPTTTDETTKPTPCDAVRIAVPCDRAWSSLEGEGATRWCGDCQLEVHDMSAMTAAEARRFREARRGERVCGRVRLDRAGRAVHRPEAPARRGRLGHLILGAAMSASLALSSAACDGHGRLSFPTFEELKTAIVGEPEVEMMVGELEALPPEPTPSAPDASGAGGDGGATAE